MAFLFLKWLKTKQMHISCASYILGCAMSIFKDPQIKT